MPSQKKKTNSGGVALKKRNLSLSVVPAVFQRFDDFVKKNGFKNRADAFEKLMNDANVPESSSDAVDVLTTSTTRSRRRKKSGSDTPSSALTTESEWNDDEIEKLKSAVERSQPKTEKEWKSLADSVGNNHSWEKYRQYAREHFDYWFRLRREPVRKPRILTLRTRRQRKKDLNGMVRNDGRVANDAFEDEELKLSAKVKAPTVLLHDIMNDSFFNTPASGVSFSSRFGRGMNDSSRNVTPRSSIENMESDLNSSEVGKRADRCVHKIKPLVTDALSTAVDGFSTPKPAIRGSPRLKRKRVSNNFHWSGVKPAASKSFDTNGDDDEYYDE